MGPATERPSSNRSAESDRIRAPAITLLSALGSEPLAVAPGSRPTVAGALPPDQGGTRWSGPTHHTRGRILPP